MFRWSKAILAAAFLCAGLIVHGGVLLDLPFRSPEDLKNWHAGSVKAEVRDGVLVIDLPDRSESRGTLGISRSFPAELIAGRQIRISAEFKGENIAPAKEVWNGSKFQFELTLADGKNEWPQGKMRIGSFDWEKVSFTVNVPQNAKSARLNIGFQDSFGKLFVRNLKIDASDRYLNFAPAANMGLKDEVEGDGKGGWSDQGPDNDGGKFNFKQTVFGNVPFSAIDPAKNGGKAVMTFRSGKFPAGIESAAITLPEKRESAKYLYLLHTLCWGEKAPAGFIEITGSNGTQKITVEGGKDIYDWWAPRHLPNGFVGATWNTASGGRVGMYVSRYAVAANVGNIETVTFRTANAGAIWIVAGATLSDTKYEFPSTEKYALKADGEWKALQRPASPAILAGSALDRSGYFPLEKVGKYGRVIVTPQGKLAFEKRPDTPVRFFSSADGSETFWGRRDVLEAQFASHERIKAYVEELRRNGYNMTRTHFLDTALMRGSKQDLEFNPETLDQFDYFVYCLKENGIYLNFDAMSSWTGYTIQSPWAPGNSSNGFKYAIYFDPEVRKNWIEGVKKLICRVNPYTQTRLVDDPVLALIIGFNEQEFAFLRQFSPELNAPEWRKFLAKRYISIENIRTAWGDNTLKSFEELPGFTLEESKKGDVKSTDIALFRKQVEIDITNWYRDELRKMGYVGPVSNFNMGKSFHDIAVRGVSDIVTMNSYHAHPSDYMRSGSTISQDSSIASFGGILRWSMSGRLAGKPFAMTEHAHAFWNQYRYEQAFVTGAYASLQDLDIMTAFAQPVNVTPGGRIHPFSIFHDPVARAMEFLTFFLYRRGDVTPSDLELRICDSVENFYKGGKQNNGLASNQSKLFLIGKLSVEGIEAGQKRPPFARDEVEIPLSEGATVKSDLAGFASIADVSSGLFDANLLVKQLKERKLLPAGNRSVPNSDIFESSTGELYMESRKNFLSIKTPRFQGVCAEAGGKADLGEFKVDAMSVRGCLALVSIDGENPLKDSAHMVLVVATDALNSGMVFDEKERITLREIGGNPSLVRTGRFTVTLRTGKELKLYPLTVTGARGKAIAPVKTDGGLSFTIDTGALPEGPALFFELAP